MIDNDLTGVLQQAVSQAVAEREPLQIVAGNSKAFYGRETQGKIVKLDQHRGVINYQPSELVITARTGTPLTVIEKLLAQHGQMLAFEPPHFAATATLGGAVASGLSGPRRPFTGAARDFVLGCKMINGKAEILRFGGEVMKNVAGYDVARLMVGAMGTLGLLLEVSLKVLPLPVRERSVWFELPPARAMRFMLKLAAGSLPVSGLCYDDGRVVVRLSGTEQSVGAAVTQLGGEVGEGSDDYWLDLREQQSRFFQQPGNLWRLSVPPAAPELKLDGNWLYDWGGAQRWLKTNAPAETVFKTACQAEGHALLFRGRDRSGEVFQPLPEKLQSLNFNLKKAFDPAAVFNPYRLSRAW